MIKAVVFDLDHTLFDRYKTLEALMPRFCETFDTGLQPEEAGKLLCKYDKAFNHLGWPVVFKQLTEHGMFRTIPDFIDYKRFLLESFKQVSVDYPFTKPMLTELRTMGLPVAMLTNGRHEIQAAKIENLGYAPYFDEILISGDYPFEKPNAEIFLEMARRLHIEPAAMLYVGDNPINDIMGAHNAGCPAVWVKTTGVWVDGIAEAEYAVSNVSELPALVKRINGKE